MPANWSLLAEPDAWFAYPFWLDDRLAPDYARTVDIHRKPGYDPCELFFDPKLWWPKGRAMRRLLQKKLGFRTLFDVVPLDAGAGAAAATACRRRTPQDRPLLIGDGPAPAEAELPMTAVHDLLGQALAAVRPRGRLGKTPRQPGSLPRVGHRLPCREAGSRRLTVSRIRLRGNGML